MTTEEVIIQLKQKSSASYLAGMKRFGIDNSHALGTPLPEVRKIGKAIKKDHALALQLWDTKIHEARMLASIIADAALVTTELMDAWVMDFNSWDICDQVCGNLFCRTPFAIEKAIAFCRRNEEFVKRAGFVLMAEYAMHNKTADDAIFIAILPITEREAGDNRNFVKKAINWTIRQIGKRNDILRIAAIETANRILLQNSKASNWIASKALNELTNRISR